MEDEYYAHSRSGKPPEEWHRLEDHLNNVAKMARAFADNFRAGDWGHLAGLWHDLGKYSRGFQDYLRRENEIDAHIETTPGRVDHSSAGAHHAVRMLPILGHLLARMVYRALCSRSPRGGVD